MGLKRTAGGQKRESLPEKRGSTAADTTGLIFTSGALQHLHFQTNIQGVTDKLGSSAAPIVWDTAKPIRQEGFGQEMFKKEAPEFKFSDRLFFSLSPGSRGEL